MPETSGRVVLVTGTSSGIGLATAVAFAAAGDTVVATMRDLGRAGALRQAVEAAQVDVELHQLDVTDDASVDGCLEALDHRFGRLDVVVNNAGVGSSGTLEEISLDDLRQSIETNLLGVARVTKAVLPAMRAAGAGRIIAVSSIAGAFGQPFNDAYCAAKCATEGLYEALHPVIARFGVHLSLVEAGPVANEFRERSSGVGADRHEGVYAELWKAFSAVADAGYVGAQTNEEVAAVIVAVAAAEAPVLRYQTSEAVTKLVGRKLADLTGERVTSMTARWLG
jgi:NAD(P)-dependent dehydrogenase (short-subunit alcohol dehydrogenase family)